ncbi:insulin-like growth factor 2 mRNA-binding protein 1 [Mytilus galloprovincialis]|uniref:Insulin-like growth factor 2 mRNA-binding protein 1 n=1 Tax=Mytilus galloprovincialis TaxID=29158 RepID=A0A8B6DGX5_MYTGA|nr:insulin-like growth factor 2 mRNA-binding protein 1 [Mytilus galloprovincialis]
MDRAVSDNAECEQDDEEPPSMFRVYCGNLSPAVNEETLRDLFEEHDIEIAGNVLVKRNYAFVDCPDQENVDKAIDKLNQYNLLGSVMQVEPSNSRRRRPSNKIQIRNLPSHVTREETESLVSPFGNVVKCEQVGAEALVYVTFETPEQAQQAVAGLNGFEFQDRMLKVDFANNRPPMNNNNRRRMNGQNQQQNRQPEFPMRMLVGSEFVGAVIGRQGQTIHGITTQTRARVDIHKREHLSSDTLVTIKGSPESCTEACKEIYKVVQTEAQSLNKGEYPMKVLCPNSVCGRIIGKQGNVIKNFMEQTGAHIIVSSATDMSNFYIDRVITITGTVDACSKAEALLSEKMRKCLDQDAQSYNQQMNMFGGMPPMGMMGPGPSNMGYQNMRNFPPYGMEQGGGGGNYYPGIYGQVPNVPPQQELEVTYLYIPENTVGAVIGSKGSNIKEIMRLSSARIKILPQKNGEMNGDRKQGGPQNQMDERKVIITGSAESQWKAQFYIFDKIKSEGGFARIEEVHLRSEVMVPRSMVGRIIGKGGQNVREMQRVSGAIVKLPEVNSQQNPQDDSEVAVSIIGHFYAMQPAIRRIRSLVNQRGNQQGGMMGGPMGGMGGPPQQRRPRREQNGN